mmetsp:Transcript_63/g.195  ORF Transcript_63/g.195 Transcript_63/m.195 type:complete len:206 (+) Transcript_63:1-618(+)
MASACGGPTFKLSACIQGFQNADEGTVASSSSRGPKPGSRPFVTLSCGQRSKQTEVGDWADDERRFRFDEALTLEVNAESEVCVSLSCSQEYDLFVAALDLRPTRIGEACFPVSSVLSELVKKETDLDGFVYASQTIGLDLYKEGAKVGRLHLSFETKSLPTAQSTSRSSLCCAPCRMDDDEIAVIGDRASATPCLLNKKFLATT